jgi:hypothetical protein
VIDKSTVEFGWNDKYLVDPRRIGGELVDRTGAVRMPVRRDRGQSVGRGPSLTVEPAGRR